MCGYFCMTSAFRCSLRLSFVSHCLSKIDLCGLLLILDKVQAKLREVVRGAHGKEMTKWDEHHKVRY